MIDGPTILVILLLVMLISILFINPSSRSYFTNIKENKKFTVPPSFTKLSATRNNVVTAINTKGINLLEKYAKKLNSLSNVVTIVDEVNIINTPSFFNSNEKWVGCLPRPLFQGSCGSCWGFATVTCLSARFFIESCGNSGCNNYPQVNAGSLDDVFSNINAEYSFKKNYLKNFASNIDTNKNGQITKSEWIESASKYQKQVYDSKTDGHIKHMIVQILVYMLDFQSLGSLDIKDNSLVKKRAEKTYKIWGNNKPFIVIKDLEKIWRADPLNLSAEKLIACCTDCLKLDFQAKGSYKADNPVCTGGSLIDAWTLLRDTGTTSALCIGYNLDNYVEGDKPLSCGEIQGPYYSFCSGYTLDKYKNLQQTLDKLENTKIYPPAMSQGLDVPWIDPQIFRFRAKNAYTIKNDMLEIQREILQRGPVNSGFQIYKDFEGSFGGLGLGGQLYAGGNPLGSDKNSLIYMKDPDTTEEPVGGHAITIVGWGSFKYSYRGTVYYIPYWTCLNSWGVEWGHNGFPVYTDRNGVPDKLKMGGYFWIVRGINNCGIEENVTCGQPNLENMSYPGVVSRYGWGADPPSLNNQSVTFLPVLDTNDKSVRGSSSLEILPAIEGGGTYVNLTQDGWQVKSMEPPSPYLMFWPERRPTFCLGTILNNLSTKDTIIKVSDKTIVFLNIVVPVSKNPLLLIGDDDSQEQIQLLEVMDDSIKVNRAVNYNTAIVHKKGSQLKIFPYQNLFTNFLKNNGFTECEV